MALLDYKYNISVGLEVLGGQGEYIDAIVKVTYHYDEPDMSVGLYGGCVIDEIECEQDIELSRQDRGYLEQLCEEDYRERYPY